MNKELASYNIQLDKEYYNTCPIMCRSLKNRNTAKGKIGFFYKGVCL